MECQWTNGHDICNGCQLPQRDALSSSSLLKECRAYGGGKEAPDGDIFPKASQSHLWPPCAPLLSFLEKQWNGRRQLGSAEMALLLRKKGDSWQGQGKATPFGTHTGGVRQRQEQGSWQAEHLRGAEQCRCDPSFTGQAPFYSRKTVKETSAQRRWALLLAQLRCQARNPSAGHKQPCHLVPREALTSESPTPPVPRVKQSFTLHCSFTFPSSCFLWWKYPSYGIVWYSVSGRLMSIKFSKAAGHESRIQKPSGVSIHHRWPRF